MSFEIKGTIIRPEEGGALLLEETGKPITPLFEEGANGEDVIVELYIDGNLYEDRPFRGMLTAMYEENGGPDEVDETIIIMEEDGSVDDIVDILNENLGKQISIVVND